jgi:hypothetical protein
MPYNLAIGCTKAQASQAWAGEPTLWLLMDACFHYSILLLELHCAYLLAKTNSHSDGLRFDFRKGLWSVRDPDTLRDRHAWKASAGTERVRVECGLPSTSLSVLTQARTRPVSEECHRP